MNKGSLDDVLRIARWTAGSYALFFAVLLGSHVIGRALGYGARRPVFAPDDVYWALATAALCLGVVIITRVLRARSARARAARVGSRLG